MALLVDGPACTIDDLVDHDAGLLETAQTCGINLTTKLRLAAQELQNDIQAWLDRPRTLLDRFTGPGARMDQVVVTPTLKVWLAMHTLELVYRDGYFSQLVDRYQAKWIQYARLARDARENAVAAGLGIVLDPMPAALAPDLDQVDGPQPGGSFYAAVAWVNAAGQAGAASPASAVTVGDGRMMTVSAKEPPANAIGFNVYAGSVLETLRQQNDLPVPAGEVFYYTPTSARHNSPLAGGGQTPDTIRALPRSIQRG